MKKFIYILGLFFCLALLQLVKPISTIIRYETILNNGKQFRFKTQPVDPYDAFRGRYVALGVEENKTPLPEGLKLRHFQKVYALIKEDDKGFAKIAGLSIERPVGDDYIQVRVSYCSRNEANLILPFNRYYMEETLAPAAERAYRGHNVRGNQDAYITVRVKSGDAVVEELYIAGKPILEFLKEQK
ncbi:MAG: GDYXXLXY domain-containing protein [Candidatus Omnitrophica bacterium]|nr:GDYXXLXY domain-containing protein [Candidatus Omnitrophota bacterium]MBU1047687.1 GDYXXLXY domain-containing protein [Candidatus Omnitrophota bacterium]MBU1631430.1 GDYXXLXY domain-containing protein [Candidatus Omnitrophota bacterium]MBU1767155.1 GDYXXLXY domain-containing protein [Candidatus Omnitrophota bacterium]MBU1888583.1 GDYXXLXY domain-containing protein [Candidatus Omnitrophota bacterium]